MLAALYQVTLNLKEQAVRQDLPFVSPDQGGIGGFLSQILTALIALAAVSVFIFLVWGAFDWINSSGEKGKVESARNKMTGAVMGLFVLAMVLVIFMFIQQILGIRIINFLPHRASRPLPASVSNLTHVNGYFRFRLVSQIRDMLE